TCDAAYRFSLGSGPLSVAAVAHTNRWSPDGTISLMQNDLGSGVVAGKSSAPYSLILNEGRVRGLGKEPVPIRVPAAPAAPSPADEPRPGILYQYLTT